MAIKLYKPTTASRRGMSVVDYSELDDVEPMKSALKSKQEHAGRNNHGRITVRHQGGAQRNKYRIIDWKRDKRRHGDVPIADLAAQLQHRPLRGCPQPS